MFGQTEVVEAIRNHRRCIGTPLPAGTVTHCRPEGDAASGTVRVRITLGHDPTVGTTPTPSEAAPQEIVVENSSLAAALILFCRERGIPLPAHSSKSLLQADDQVCLIAAITPEPDTLSDSRRLPAKPVHAEGERQTSERETRRWTEFRMAVAEWLVEAALALAPRGHPDKIVLGKHISALRLEMLKLYPRWKADLSAR